MITLHSPLKQRSVCLCIQFHHSLHLSKTSIFSVGHLPHYFQSKTSRNKEVFHHDAEKGYIPLIRLLKELLKKYPFFSLGVSFSGIFLEQVQEHKPRMLGQIRDLISHPRVELISEPYYHSISALFSMRDFAEQIQMHRLLMWKLFKKRPVIFRNTEFLYNDKIANFIKALGFKGLLVNLDHTMLGSLSPHHLYDVANKRLSVEDESIAHKLCTTKNKDMKILIDDKLISSMFEEDSIEPGKRAQKILFKIKQKNSEITNLFLNAQVFGIKRNRMSGIFLLLRRFVQHAHTQIQFSAPSSIIQTLKPFRSFSVNVEAVTKYRSVKQPVLQENELQRSCAKELFHIESVVKRKSRKEDTRTYNRYVDVWRKLQDANFFEEMETSQSLYDKKNLNSPYETFIDYMNVIEDFSSKLKVYKKTVRNFQ